jgi:hypothetical protein
MNRLACGIKIPRRIVEIKKTPNDLRVCSAPGCEWKWRLVISSAGRSGKSKSSDQGG